MLGGPGQKYCERLSRSLESLLLTRKSCSNPPPLPSPTPPPAISDNRNPGKRAAPTQHECEHVKHRLEMLGSLGKARDAMMIKGELVQKREKEKAITHCFLSPATGDERESATKEEKEKESFKDGKNHLTMIPDDMRSPHLSAAQSI